jgi:three-Cys-motif partner protein
MTPSHQFGGPWTEDKLNRLQKYLNAYLKIFKTNPKAAYFQTIYVDAFAGTGSRSPKVAETTEIPFFQEEADVKDFQRGSAWIALKAEPSFDQYLFIEQNPSHARQLEQLKAQFPHKASRVSIQEGDANQVLKKWCRRTSWQKHRAVVFLDPYGMQVEWATIKIIAETKAIDLWILFPLGQGVNRLLTRQSPPEGAWADRLTTIFGTSRWKDAFYQPSLQMSMFDTGERLEKTATFEEIKRFFLERLKSTFAGVAESPLFLYNSKNVPIYLLCFASANPKGATTAVRIAQHILSRSVS